MFFGTPHRGLNVDNMRMMMGQGCDPCLLNAIEKDSPELEDLSFQFKNVLGDRRVVSFYEQQPTPSIVEVSNVYWVIF